MLNNPDSVIENKKAKIVLLDGEVVILKKAKLAEQVEIQELLKRKEELEQQTFDIALSLEGERDCLKDVQSNLAKTIQEVSDEQGRLDELSKEFREKAGTLDRIKNTIGELEVRINNKENTLEELTLKLKEKGSNLNKFVEKSSELFKYVVVIIVIIAPIVAAYMFASPQRAEPPVFIQTQK